MGQCSRCGKHDENLQNIADCPPDERHYGNLCAVCFQLWGLIWDKKVAIHSANEIKYRQAWDREWDNFLLSIFERVC